MRPPHPRPEFCEFSEQKRCQRMREEGQWGEKVDRRNVLESQGVQFQQMSALVLEGRERGKKPWERKYSAI